MNKMKSGYLKMLVIGGFLAFGLFSCKTSKKAADASQAEPAETTEEVVVAKVKNEPVKLKPAVSEEEKRNSQIEKYFSGGPVRYFDCFDSIHNCNHPSNKFHARSIAGLQ